MKYYKIALVLLVLAVSSSSLGQDKDPVLRLQGEIADSQCAFNVHSLDRSHNSMIGRGEFGKDAASCTRHCIKRLGGLYVLVVKDHVYRLDDQARPEFYSGKKVKITATLADAKTDTLHVLTIAAVQ